MILKEVQFIASNIGYIPILPKRIRHGFSWGKNAPNMSFKHGHRGDVEQAEQQFFRAVGVSRTCGLAVMVPEHGTKIVDVRYCDGDHRRKNIACDCLVTRSAGLTLAVKPADCIVAIITTTRPETPLLAIMHAGRKGLDVGLARTVVEHLCAGGDVNPNELIVGIAPCITVRNHFIRAMAELENPREWEGFVDLRDGLFFLDFVKFIRHQFSCAGVLDANIMQYDVDTLDAARNGHSFSHRHWQLNPGVRNGRFVVAAEIAE